MKQNKSTKGFTLIELLIVVGVIAVLAGIVLVSLRGAKEGENNESFVCGEDKMIDLEGNEYDTVEIGGLCWMAENLRYLPEVHDNATFKSHGTSKPAYGVYKYEDDVTVEGAKAHIWEGVNIYETYGVLYNWKAAVKACPPGTRLPTDKEWHSLELFFTEEDETCVENRPNGTWDCEPAGTALKATTTWDSGDCTNSSGFTALAGGDRGTKGSFSGFGEYAYFWSSDGSASNAWYRTLGSSETGIYRVSYSGACGFSVRCVKEI